MTEQGHHDWQHLEPPLQALDHELRGALKGPAPRAEFTQAVFESTADHVMAGDLADELRRSLSVASDVSPPAGLADRIASVTQPRQVSAPPPRRILAKVGPFAVAATLLFAVGLAVHLASSPETVPPDRATTPTAGSSPAIAVVGLEDPLDAIEWALANDDDMHLEVSAIAADLDSLAHRESDAAIEDELARQQYYYELAEASYGSY